MNKPLVWIGIIVGIGFVALAVLYWITPAGALPSFMPGYEAGSSAIHVKHGIASLLLGLAVLAYAWFQTGPKHS